MSPSTNIRRRSTVKKGTRYQVRYRPGGRESDWVGVGTFATLAEARACQRWADGELAAGRRPDLRAHLGAQSPAPTVADVVAEYGRTQTAAAQAKRQRNMERRMGALGEMVATEVTGRDVQAWIDAQTTGDDPLAPSSIGQYLGQLRRAFAWNEITPNPCEWTHLRLPRREGGEPAVDPPELDEVRAMLDVLSPPYHRGVVVLMESTGMRIDSEALRLTWGDVDWRRSRIRIPGTKTAAARRWAPLWGELRELLERTPPEDRVATERVFPRSTDNAVRNAMARACKAAGIRHLHPHDLRDRFISLCALAGVPLALIREMAGHEDNTTTLNTYTGTILHEPTPRLEALREAVAVMHGLSRGTWVGPETGSATDETADSRGNLPDGGYRDRTDALSADPAPHGLSPARQGEADAADKRP